MITYFWQWIVQATSAALSWLNQLFSGETMQPFRYLFVAVFAFVIIMNYVIRPMTAGRSDRAKKKDEEE